MAALNLKQIEDRLNREFAGSGELRRLIFWYDDHGDFREDVDALALTGAKVYRLEPDNQFYTKYFLERVDPNTSYLIYAPFPRPDPADNHLEDTLLYSRQFFADRMALLCADLGIREELRPLLNKHSALFGDKSFVQRFRDLEIDVYNEETIETGLLCAACKVRSCSFDEALCALLTAGDLADNPLLAELERRGLTEILWRICERQFGYADPEPTLERLVVTLFVTCADRSIPAELPEAWRSFVSGKAGSSISFLDGMKNSVLYQARYDALSDSAAKGLGAEGVLETLPAEDLLECDAFRAADRILIRWLTERLLAEDTGAKLNGLGIPEICEKRLRMHFGREYELPYRLLENAYVIISAAYACPDGLLDIVKQYQETGSRLDQAYRRFYRCLDRLEDAGPFEPLRELTENIYTNEYLAKLLPRWNAALAEPDSLEALPLQRDFYARHIKNSDVRTVVIISDALRYEVGQELLDRMRDDPKCSSAKLEAALGVLPSYTQLGMAALLPHNTLELTGDCQVLTDGIQGADLAARQRILQGHCPQSACVRLDEIKGMKVAGLREIFTGKQVVYVYQDQIDARGDEPRTEDEVFAACEEAVEEIFRLIRRLASGANTVRFIVTADHGFLYQRGERTESGKISGGRGSGGDLQGRRFLVSETPLREPGIQSLPLGRILGNGDGRFVSFPVGNSVFKLPGGGQNYVHGGSSPQELLIPVLEARMEKGHVETHPVQITLVSILRKVTNLITNLDFVQTEPVSDAATPASYQLFFVSERDERISNENTYLADSRERETQRRIFRLKFTFKNRKYDRDGSYALVIRDAATGLEILRHPVIMDLAFTDDFGFRV